ncbi:hypothetical protein BU16DRAFT_46992 [Lophium mytilinum]|uniref:Uncharacterized protein n=1 Tax=Lophium mytilinum TaxID=390894 RepID=A0A6A6QQR5_9PEZI|nr:hypothetical protein BU16DRAFT_46992 [Lophium mytilinum]
MAAFSRTAPRVFATRSAPTASTIRAFPWSLNRGFTSQRLAADQPSISRASRQVELEILKRLQGPENTISGAVSHDELTNLADLADLGRIKEIMDNPGGQQPGFALFRARHTVLRAISANSRLKVPILSPAQVEAWSEVVALDFDREDDSVKQTAQKTNKGFTKTIWEELLKDPPKPGESLRDFSARSMKQLDSHLPREEKSSKPTPDLPTLILIGFLAIPCTAATVALLDWLGILEPFKVNPAIKDTKPKTYDPPEA